MRRVTLIVLLMACSSLPALAGEGRKGKGDESAILASVKSYVAAYNRGDAKAVADHWSDRGEWISPAGERFRGRKAIEDALTAMFAEHKGVHLEVPSPSVRLVTADVAVEEGRARVVRPGAPPSESTYLAIHVKQEGAWKLDSVRETELPAAPSHFEQLQDLEWMIGDWIDQDEESTVQTSVTWAKNKNFILASFRVSVPGMDELEGTQVIGWDPAANTIRSWLFDSDGGFGEGTWTRKGDGWVVKMSTVLPEGGRASATNIYTRVDDDTYTWQSVGRQVDGKYLPNVEEVKVVRKPAVRSRKAEAKK
jgi:uncharacterized protein (TIGR02246 family)